VVPAVAVGEADGPHRFPQALVPPVEVEAGGGPLPGERPGGPLQEHPGDQAVQHPAHAVVVEEVGGDALPQEQLGGLALEEAAEEVEGGGDEAQGVQEGGLEETFSPGLGPTRRSTLSTNRILSSTLATRPRS
jgi:hypothetical protein